MNRNDPVVETTAIAPTVPNEPAAVPTNPPPVTLISVEILPKVVLEDGREIPPRRVEHWSDGLFRTEFLFPPPPPDPLGEAAFKAQIVAQRWLPRDDWAIPREHENDLAVAFGVPEFKTVRGTLEVALRNLLAARSPEDVKAAREELLGVARGLTLRGLVGRLLDDLGPHAVEDLKNQAAPPSLRAHEAWCEIVDTWARPVDGPNLEPRYTRETLANREFRARDDCRVEHVFDETAVPQSDPRQDRGFTDAEVRREWSHRRTKRPMIGLDPEHAEAVEDTRGDRETGERLLERLDLEDAIKKLGLRPDELRALAAYGEGRTQSEAAASVWPELGAAGQKRISLLLERVRAKLNRPS
jgi:hypothetical protein